MMFFVWERFGMSSELQPSENHRVLVTVVPAIKMGPRTSFKWSWNITPINGRKYMGLFPWGQNQKKNYL